jgi:Nuclease-related domain
MTLETATTVTVRQLRGVRGIDPLRLVAAAAAQVHDWAAKGGGQRRTGRVLQSLDPAIWRVHQNIQLADGGHADHLVIGPGGAYLLDSRAWHGAVTVDHKGATITPEGRPAAAWTARGQHCSLAPAAARFGRVVSRPAGSPLPTPRAVVVIWAPFPDGLAVSGGITYVAGEYLADWLSGEPRRGEDHTTRTSLVGDPAGPVVAPSLA